MKNLSSIGTSVGEGSWKDILPPQNLNKVPVPIKYDDYDSLDPEQFANSIKYDPKAIIAWCEKEIKEYRKLIKLVRTKWGLDKSKI